MHFSSIVLHTYLCTSFSPTPPQRPTAKGREFVPRSADCSSSAAPGLVHSCRCLLPSHTGRCSGEENGQRASVPWGLCHVTMGRKVTLSQEALVPRGVKAEQGERARPQAAACACASGPAGTQLPRAAGGVAPRASS